MIGQLAYSAGYAAAPPFVPSKLKENIGGVASAGTIMNFAQDREIYAEGALANVFFKVVSGVVRTCKLLSDGRRQIDAFYRPGDIFGIETGTERALSAEAVSDCILVCYRYSATDAGTSGGDWLFDQLLRQLARAQDHVLLLGRRSALERVAAFLVDWADQSGNKNVATLAMTRQDMADYLGLTIETVSRTLSLLERDRIIAIPAARQIKLRDLEALRQMNV